MTIHTSAKKAAVKTTSKPIKPTDPITWKHRKICSDDCTAGFSAESSLQCREWLFKAKASLNKKVKAKPCQ
eukprot:1143672-Pelagomonas_calceolata.AAC.7